MYFPDNIWCMIKEYTIKQRTIKEYINDYIKKEQLKIYKEPRKRKYEGYNQIVDMFNKIKEEVNKKSNKEYELIRCYIEERKQIKKDNIIIIRKVIFRVYNNITKTFYIKKLTTLEILSY